MRHKRSKHRLAQNGYFLALSLYHSFPLSYCTFCFLFWVTIFMLEHYKLFLFCVFCLATLTATPIIWKQDANRWSRVCVCEERECVYERERESECVYVRACVCTKTFEPSVFNLVLCNSLHHTRLHNNNRIVVLLHDTRGVANRN